MNDMKKATHYMHDKLYRHGWKTWYVWDNDIKKWKTTGIPLHIRLNKIVR